MRVLTPQSKKLSLWIVKTLNRRITNADLWVDEELPLRRSQIVLESLFIVGTRGMGL